MRPCKLRVRGSPRARRRSSRPPEARRLLDRIDPNTLAGLRDRALLSVMLYSFARVTAVLGMRRQDYFGQGNRGWLRLHEKGGKRHDVRAQPPGRGGPRRLRRGGRARGAEGGALPRAVDPAGRRLTGRALERPPADRPGVSSRPPRSDDSTPSSTATTPPRLRRRGQGWPGVPAVLFFPSPGARRLAEPRLARAGSGPMAGGARTAMNAGYRGLVDELQLRADPRPRTPARSAGVDAAGVAGHDRPRPSSSTWPRTACSATGSSSARSCR